MALAFSNSRPPIDSIQADIVIHYSAVQSHLQKLFAMTQVAPVVPVMNPLIAAMTQPIERNIRVYKSYGHAFDMTTMTDADRMNLYSSVPVQMKIDHISVQTIPEASRDLRILIRLVRVLTANSYGDRVQYVTTVDGAYRQHQFIEKARNHGGDTVQTDAIASMLGIKADRFRYMIQKMSKKYYRHAYVKTITGTITGFHDIDVVDITDGNDTYRCKLAGIVPDTTPEFVRAARAKTGSLVPASEMHRITGDPVGYVRRTIGRDTRVTVRFLTHSPVSYDIWGQVYPVKITDDQGDIALLLLRKGYVGLLSSGMYTTEDLYSEYSEFADENSITVKNADEICAIRKSLTRRALGYNE